VAVGIDIIHLLAPFSELRIGGHAIIPPKRIQQLQHPKRNHP
jgi:hypothetical protein